MREKYGVDIPMVMIDKTRTKANEVDEMVLIGDVDGKDIVIVDDMADTLGTMCKAAELLIDKGAKSVRAIATHGILSGKAYTNLESSVLTELLVSDSIQANASPKLKVISCDRIIGKSIWGLVNRQSIHELNAI